MINRIKINCKWIFQVDKIRKVILYENLNFCFKTEKKRKKYHPKTKKTEKKKQTHLNSSKLIKTQSISVNLLIQIRKYKQCCEHFVLIKRKKKKKKNR